MKQVHFKKDSWDAGLYDGKYSFVSRFGHDLIDLLEPKKGEHILDLGCGTGDLANSIHNLGANIVGVDKSENMVRQAQGKYPNVQFMVRDAINLNLKNEFDAVFSNATLHWIKTPQQAIQNIFNALKPGGRFVAEFGGNGNVQIITDGVFTQYKKLGIKYEIERFPWYFPTIGEYTTMMEKVGFRVTFAHHFDRPTPLEGESGLRNWLNMFGSGLFGDIDEATKDTVIANCENSLRKILYKDDRWVADYKRIRVIGIK